MATQPIDIMASFEQPPPTIDFVLPGMVAGTIGALISPGGVGKSILALQLAAQVAGGPDLLGLGELRTGQVVYLPAEDPPITVIHRLHALGGHLNTGQRKAVATGLLIQPLLGAGPNLMSQEWHEGLKRAGEGRRLMILDTLRRYHAAEENDSGAMSQIIGRMESISSVTGCSILYLHHTNKGSAMIGAGDQQQASRGSSVLTDNIRWQAYMSGMTTPQAEARGIDNDQRGYYVRFGLSKSNYAKPMAAKWYKRAEGGILIPVELERQRKASKAKGKGVQRGEA